MGCGIARFGQRGLKTTKIEEKNGLKVCGLCGTLRGPMVPLLEVRGKNFETRTYYIYSCWHFIAKNAKQVRSIHEDKLSNNFALNWQSFVYTPSKHEISATRRSKILLFGTTNLVFSLMQNIKRTKSKLWDSGALKKLLCLPKLAIVPKKIRSGRN